MANENANAALAVEVAATEAAANVQVENQVEVDANQSQPNQTQSPDEILKSMIADGWKRLRGLNVRNVRITELDNYVRLCFLTANSVIPRYIFDDETGEYKHTLDNKVFTSLYSVIGVMRDDAELSVVCNKLQENPQAITALVTGGAIDIVYKEFAEGDTFSNPFASNPEEITFDHDTVITIVTGVTPGNVGRRIVDAGLAALGASLFGI